jgi:hypothetical protein
MGQCLSSAADGLVLDPTALCRCMEGYPVDCLSDCHLKIKAELCSVVPDTSGGSSGGSGGNGGYNSAHVEYNGQSSRVGSGAVDDDGGLVAALAAVSPWQPSASFHKALREAAMRYYVAIATASPTRDAGNQRQSTHTDTHPTQAGGGGARGGARGSPSPIGPAAMKLPPADFQQRSLFLGMQNHSEHLAYLAEHY